MLTNTLSVSVCIKEFLWQVGIHIPWGQINGGRAGPGNKDLSRKHWTIVSMSLSLSSLSLLPIDFLAYPMIVHPCFLRDFRWPCWLTIYFQLSEGNRRQLHFKQFYKPHLEAWLHLEIKDEMKYTTVERHSSTRNGHVQIKQFQCWAGHKRWFARPASQWMKGANIYKFKQIHQNERKRDHLMAYVHSDPKKSHLKFIYIDCNKTGKKM